MSRFLETIAYERNRLMGFALAEDGATHAGLALVQAGAVFMAKRSMDETDDPDVQETWEFPGGGLESGEQPYEGALREFLEETGLTLPADAHLRNAYRSGPYQCFILDLDDDLHDEDFTPTSEVQAVGWFTRETLPENMRPEMAETPWDLVLGEDTTMDTNEPDYTGWSLASPDLKVHGIIAPEAIESGDGRGFTAGAMTSRPNRLPLSYQKESNPGHDKSVVAGSVDRMMRSGGMIHFEGGLMDTAEADEFAGLIAYFGQFGVSVDGDKGSVDAQQSAASGVLWFDAIRAAGLTGVHIPAFHEAYVAFGPHPDMPREDAMVASAIESGDLMEFGRGPGYVTNPVATNRIHDYWTKPGKPGFAKVGWGTPGDFARAKALIGAKIAEHSPNALKYLNAIIAQWHFDALGYWPATHAKMVRDGVKASLQDYDLEREDIVLTDDAETKWETVLVSSAAPRPKPPIEYFHRRENPGSLVIDDPDENGYIRTSGYVAEWGVCHIGFANKCVEPPRTGSDEYSQFHLGKTKVEGGLIYTGLLTYGVEHRDATTILSQSATQQHFENIHNAWSAVRIGEDDRGIWFSGVVLPKMDNDDLIAIAASGQVSGEWKHGALRAALTVNIPGFPVQNASAEYDEYGNVTALSASAHAETIECTDPHFTAEERIAMQKRAWVENEMEKRREEYNSIAVADVLMDEAQDEGRMVPVAEREDGAVIYELDGQVPGNDVAVS